MYPEKHKRYTCLIKDYVKLIITGLDFKDYKKASDDICT